VYTDSIRVQGHRTPLDPWSDGGMQEAEVSLTGDKWEKHPIATSLEAPFILGIDYLMRGYFKDQKGYQ